MELSAGRFYSISLEPWKGREVKLSLVTASADEKHGWAAWAAPRIVFREEQPGFSWKSFLTRRAERFASSAQFRHP